jgi:hypothetical protein
MLIESRRQEGAGALDPLVKHTSQSRVTILLKVLL